LSSIPGCRYMSVASTEEFTTSIANEFAHDVTPVALNICVELAQDGKWTFEKGVGSAELNGITRGDMQFAISSEFPMPSISEDGLMKGGMLLLKLSPKGNIGTTEEQSTEGQFPPPINLLSSWTTLDGDGVSHSQNVEFITVNKDGTMLSKPDTQSDPPSLWNRVVRGLFGTPSPSFVEVSVPNAGVTAVRKAVALMKYVEIQNDYCLDDMHDRGDAGVHQHQAWVDKVERFKRWFEAELENLGDKSLSGENTASAQTLGQIIDLEKQEIKEKQEAEEKAKLRGKSLEKLREAMKTQKDLVPHSFMCPISQDIMEDAVIASDGHSYDRSQIERWFSTKKTSPKTGAVLHSTALIPNHSLQQAIQEFASSFDNPEKKDEAAAITAMFSNDDEMNTVLNDDEMNTVLTPRLPRLPSAHRRKSAPAKRKRPTKARQQPLHAKSKAKKAPARVVNSNQRKRSCETSATTRRNLRPRRGSKQ